MPGDRVDALEKVGEVGGRIEVAPVGVHRLAEQRHLPAAALGEAAITSATIASGGWLRSRPRVVGTTQNVQCFSQPSITVTKALSREPVSGFAVILTSGPSPVSSTGRSLRAGARHQVADAGDGGRAEHEVHVGRALLDGPLPELRHAAHHADEELRAAAP